jgi:hypothetical protein
MEALMQRVPRSLARRFVAALSVIVVSCGVLVAASATAAHAAFTTCVVGPTCPLAQDDNYSIAFNKTLNVPIATGLLANDSGPVGTHVDVTTGVTDTVSFNGNTVNVQANGSFTYIQDPTNPFTGVDSFNYEITDGAASDTADATAYITVFPVLANDTYYAHVNQTLNVAAPGVFANDGPLDLNGVPVSFDSASVTNDPTTTPGGVTMTVNNDGSFSYTPPTNFSGIDTFTYSVLDTFDTNQYTATVRIYVDSTPPTIAMSAPPVVSLSTKFPVAWSGTDPVGTNPLATPSGIGRYNVQQTNAPWNAPFNGWSNWLAPTTATSGTPTGTYGRTYCYRAQAVDRAGNASGFVQRCTVIPLRDVSLQQTAGWTAVTNAAYFGNGAKSSRTFGTRIWRTGAQARHIYLVATVCSICGSVQIRWNNVVTANVNLARAATAHKVVFAIASLPAVQTGTLTMTVTSPNGRPVTIEGLGLLRQ